MKSLQFRCCFLVFLLSLAHIASCSLYIGIFACEVIFLELYPWDWLVCSFRDLSFLLSAAWWCFSPRITLYWLHRLKLLGQVNRVNLVWKPTLKSAWGLWILRRECSPSSWSKFWDMHFAFFWACVCVEGWGSVGGVMLFLSSPYCKSKALCGLSFILGGER